MALPLMALLAGAQAVKGLSGALLSAPKVKRPTLSENPFIVQALMNAQTEYAKKGLTGGDELQSKMDEETAGFINQAKASTNGSDFVTGLATVQSGKMAQEAEMAYMGAQEDKQDLQALNGQLGVSAEEHNRVEDWNTIGKYQDDFARKQAKNAAWASAINGTIDAGTNLITGQQMLKANNTMYGKAPAPAPASVGGIPPSAWSANAISKIGGATLTKPSYTSFKLPS